MLCSPLVETQLTLEYRLGVISIIEIELIEWAYPFRPLQFSLYTIEIEMLTCNKYHKYGRRSVHPPSNVNLNGNVYFVIYISSDFNRFPMEDWQSFKKQLIFPFKSTFSDAWISLWYHFERLNVHVIPILVHLSAKTWHPPYIQEHAMSQPMAGITQTP